MVVPGMYLADRYEILEKIGSGGMADVYKAKDHKLNRLVAAKVLKHEFSVDETFVKKFRVEAQAAAGLSHPNIVNVYDVGEENGIHYIVMELVQGITLKKYIEMKGKLEIKEALNISVQIASGLQAAHDNRIIHRDVKPQNIIMSRDGKVKVTDFGIAKMADSTTVTTNAAGSVHYISPEQARGGYSDAKSDIYSLGITMYEMLTGRVPFEGETNVAVALLHIQGEMVPPRRLEPSIPRSFEKIILKCTQKKPERRYASARDLIADLRKVLTHPDGEYVNLGTAAALANEQTVVLGSQNSKARQSASGGVSTSGSGRSGTGAPVQRNGQGMNGRPDFRQNGSSQNRAYAGKNGQNRNLVEDDDDNEGVNPALEKVMMVLGIVGAVILVVVIFFIIGKAAGLFSGGGQTDTAIESMSDSQTESSFADSETDSESSEEISVPDLYKMTEEQAQSALKKYGLYLSIKKGSSDEVPGGCIYKQDPESGEKVESGTVINVWVNEGETEETEEEVTINDVSGLSVSRAQVSLNGQGLTVANIEYEFSDTVAADTVIRTDPAAGTSVDKGSSVVIYVSKGKEVKKTTMPQVVGLSLDAAIAELTRADLNFGNETYQYSNSVAEGKVISADYSYGTSLDAGTTVSLVISKGPEPQTETESTSSQPQVYHSTVSIYDSPIGGMAEGESASVVITVYKPDGQTETIYNGTIMPEQWAPLEQNVTSTVSGSGHYEIVVDGVSYNQVPITFN